jgi:ABC-type multidrug transport system fused ATPase/permease subunit
MVCVLFIFLLQAAPLLQDMFKGKVAVQALFEVINRTPIIDILVRAEKLGAVKGTIHFCDVTFTYPTRTDRPALSKFNLEIPAGEMPGGQASITICLRANGLDCHKVTPPAAVIILVK